MESVLASLYRLLDSCGDLIIALIFLLIGFWMGKASKVIIPIERNREVLAPVPADEETLDQEGDYFSDEIPDFESVGTPKRIPTIY